MYKKLLLSAGGGIISPNQQAEQVDATTIAIGLGGTGIRCLCEMKEEVYNRIKPDNVNSGISEYRHIKFLAIDSDTVSIETNGAYQLGRNSEFFCIGYPDVVMAKHLKDDPMLDWLNPDMSIINTANGAGGNRQIGRLLFMRNSREFIDRLESLITDARTGLPSSAPLNIYIFTGMGGGTGSGIFLDVCYLVQYVLKKAELYVQAQTCGFFFLPDINLNSVNAMDTKDYIKANGFAAMKELDYCMNFSNNGG